MAGVQPVGEFARRYLAPDRRHRLVGALAKEGQEARTGRAQVGPLKGGERIGEEVPGRPVDLRVGPGGERAGLAAGGHVLAALEVRAAEMERTIQVLCRRLKNNPLFVGDPGVGKTAMVQGLALRVHEGSVPDLLKGVHIYALDLGSLLAGTKFRGQFEERVKGVMKALQDKPNSILFIDEIHRLSRPCEEILYPAMEDGCIDFVIGEGMSAQSVKLHLKPFTLVGATTRSGMLSSPLKSRFGLELKLDFYSEDDLRRIIMRSAALLQVLVDEEAAVEMARRARMTPRVAIRLVRRIRDYVTVEKIDRANRAFVQSCLERLGIDALGLIELDRRLLRLMIERYKGGPVGIKTLAALVDEEERTLEEDHEPYMLRSALMEKSPQGRLATRKAYEHLDCLHLWGSPDRPNENRQRTDDDAHTPDSQSYLF